MAVDELLMRGETTTVRFYSWQPPALSLGYFQSRAEFDTDDLRSSGIPVVRRPTGGGAIYHYRELTFAVASGGAAQKQLGTTIEERYARVHGAVINALKTFGIESEMRGGGLEPPFSPSEHKLCFNRTIGCDIVAGGRKLVGSAQRKTPEGFLQHGSIPLWENPMTPDAAWVNACAQREVAYDSLADALVRAFEKKFDVRLMPDSLNRPEESRVAELVECKYSTDAWNLRR
jgi:lipoate-protein ligase A